MPAGLQVMYTAAETREFTGYQFVAATPGLAPEEQEAIEQNSTPSAPLSDRVNFSRATAIYGLPTGRVAVSRLANIGRGYDGRPDTICTHSVVLDAEAYRGLSSRLVWIPEALRPDPTLRGPLPPLALPAVSDLPPLDPAALPAWTAAPGGLATVLEALIAGQRVVLQYGERHPESLAALEVLLALLPAPRRAELSLSTFDAAAGRPFDLLLVPEGVVLPETVAPGLAPVALDSRAATEPGPYVRAGLAAAYGGDWPRWLAFQRFLDTVASGASHLDAAWEYFARLETPADASPTARAAAEIELARLAPLVDPDRARVHLEQAIRLYSEHPSVTAARALLLEVVPAQAEGVGAEVTEVRIREVLRGVQSLGVGALSDLLDALASGAIDAPPSLRSELYAAVNSAVASVGSPGEPIPTMLRALTRLPIVPETRPARETIALRVAADPLEISPADRRVVADRLAALAAESPPSTRQGRLLDASAELFHGLGDEAGESSVRLGRLRASLSASQPPVDSWPGVSPRAYLDARPPEAGSGAGPGAPVPRPPLASLEPLPLGPSGREAGDILRHAVERAPGSGADLVGAIATVFRVEGRPEEGLAWLESIDTPSATPAVASSRRSAGFDLAAAGAEGPVPLALALRTYYRILREVGEPSASSSDRQRVRDDLEAWAATDPTIAGPTVWDSLLLVACCVEDLHVPPPDLGRWIEAIGRATPPRYGADPAELTAVLGRLKESFPTAEESAAETKSDRLLGRVRERLRPGPSARTLRTLERLGALLPTSAGANE